MLAQYNEGQVNGLVSKDKRPEYKSLRIGLFDDSRIAMLLQRSLLKEVFGNTTRICLSSQSKTIKLWILKRLIDVLIMDVVQMGSEYPLDIIQKTYNSYIEKYGTDDGFPKLIFNSSSPQWVVEKILESRYPFSKNVDWCFIQKPAKRSDLFSCILDLIGDPELFFRSNDQVRIMQNLAKAIENDNTGSPLLEGLRIAVKTVFTTQ